MSKGLVAVVDRLKDLIETAAESEGVKIRISNAKFNTGGARFAIEIEAPDKKEQDKALWDAWCSSVRMKPEHFGKKFTLGAQRMTIMGIDPNRHKNMILIENERGKRYVCSPMATGLAETLFSSVPVRGAPR